MFLYHEVKGLTDNIIAELVLDQVHEWILSSFIRRGRKSDNLRSLLVGSKFDALLHNIACILVFREHEQLSSDQCDYLDSVFWSSMFNDVLDDIVAVLIDDETWSA